MRIELDQPPVTWGQYFLHSASSAPAAAKRYYFHKAQPGSTTTTTSCSPNLTPRQAQAAASIVSLSGGNMIAGDRLTDLDTTRLEILRKVFPSFGEAARPLDLFESDKPEIFALKVKKKFGEWIVLGLFNANEKTPVDKRIRARAPGSGSKQELCGVSFLEPKSFLANCAKVFSVRLEPASVLVLAIHEKRGVPQ